MSTTEPQTMPAMLRDVASRHPHLDAVVDGDRRLTFAQLLDAVIGTARSMVAHGVQPGDRVCVWAPNQIEWILASMGAQQIGAALVPINTRYRGVEAHDILNRSGASALFVANGFLDNDYIALLDKVASKPVDGGAADGTGPAGSDGSAGERAVWPGLPALHTVVDLRATGDTSGPAISWPAFLARGAEVSEETVRELSEAVTGETLCDIIYTSGTTGRPKGAMMAHRQTIDSARAWSGLAELVAGDRYAIVNPFFHGFGYKTGLVASLLRATTIYPLETFNAETLLRLIQDEQIAILPGPPTIFYSLLESPRLNDFDIRSLRWSASGAANVPVALLERMRIQMGLPFVATAYGLTEFPVVTMARVGEDQIHVFETVGRPLDGVEVKIVDPLGAESPIGENGEVLVRGDNVMLGYYEDPEATRRAIDEEGWLHTGDVGTVDEHGCLRITDRIKDMFTVGGFNVYPAEVEGALTAHPGVSEASVIGVPDGRLGQVGYAFVVPRHDAELTEEMVLAHCREVLANFKVPRHVMVMQNLPKNASGKVVKDDLRSLSGT